VNSINKQLWYEILIKSGRHKLDIFIRIGNILEILIRIGNMAY